MGSNESKARVIDENDEYRNGVTMNYDQRSSSPSSSPSHSKRTSVSKSGFEALANVTRAAENAFALAANVLETYDEETNQNLMKWFKIVKGAKFFCVGAGIVLNQLVDDAVVRELNKISEKIREVRSDIKELERTMKWETTRIQYADICTMIVTGMEFCKQIQFNAENDSLKHDYEERLKELCSNQRFTLAMNTLLDGITGKGDFRIDILRLIYDQTNGSRPDVMRMAGRLVQLLTGGLTTLLTYETLVRGRQSAEQLEQAMYADRVKEAEQCYMNVVQRCVDESKENMAKDMDRICDGKTEYKDLPKEICSELAQKYNWLQFQCVLYTYAYFVHCHGSCIVKRVPGFPPGKIICFYTSKLKPLKTFSHSEKNQILKIVSEKDDIVTWLTEGIFKPRFCDPVEQYMKQISDQRQCWVIGFSSENVKVFSRQVFLSILTHVWPPCHEVSEGSIEHLVKRYGTSGEQFFVLSFFQD